MWWAVGLGLLGALAALVVYKKWLAPHVFGAIAQSDHQTQCLNNLTILLQPTEPLPELGGWAASPDLALLLVQTVREKKPRLVVELGSGASTEILSLAIERFSPGARLVSIEQDEKFAVEGVRHVPLRDGWYDTDPLQDLNEIDVLFIDGPSGDDALRYPALPFFFDRLSPGAVIVVDDATRPDERAALARWEKEFPDLSVEFLGFQKGAAILR